MEDWSVGQSSGTDALLDAEPTKIEFLITLRNSTSSSSSTSLAVKQPPPSTAVKNKRKADDTVLEEDAYISALDTIIQRDFFPDLPKLRAQISYVEAAQQGNDEKMQEAVRLYAAATAEQKASSSSSVSDESTLSSQVECDAQKLSLDRFQAKYTSEDNVSFSEIIEQQNQDLKKKYNWLYDASSQRLLLGPAQEIRSITDGKGSSRLAITGEGDDPVGTWKYVQKNHLLWYPEGRGSVYDDDKTVRGGFKKIKYNNTRLPEPSGDSEKTTATVNSVALSVSNDASSAYSMVAATPSPMPHTGGATPMLTWGEVDSTPLLLDSNTDVGPLSSKASEPVFRIPEPPKREVLSKKLSDEASKNLRMRQKKPGTPFLASRSGSSSRLSQQERYRLLSPAAQNLLQRSRLGTPLTQRQSTPAASRVPTPTSKLVGVTPRPSSVTRQTPSAMTPVHLSSGSGESSREPARHKSNLTDNLLP